MTELKQCTRCGLEIPADARWGMCPRCLLEPGGGPPQEPREPFAASFSEESRWFGDYRLGRQLGRGGMGVVYEAFQASLQRTVAVKMILDTHVLVPVARRRFAIEAEAAAKLDHPNIVPIYEVGEHLDQPFLSMKLVQGESLRQKIDAGELCVARKHGDSTRSALRCRERTVARLMESIGRAVHHAHQHGVLHRDLKPGNILIDLDGQPHLTDFGLAKIIHPPEDDGDSSGLTEDTVILGTPSYMSPEQASGQRLSAASDVHGLGAILYELLTGQPPFQAQTALETVRLVVEHETKRPRALHPHIHPDLDTICMKCLEKNPHARYASALAFAEDLERWLRQEPIRARPAGPGLRLRRWVKRNPVGAGLIASLCLALGASLLWLQGIYAQKTYLDTLAGMHGDELLKEVQEFWDQPDRPFVQLSSAKLATLDHRIPKLHDAQTVPLRWALTIADEPLAQATAYAPLLGALEELLTRRLGHQVLIDLFLYKARSWDSPAVGRGEVDVQRVSALTYVRLSQTVPRPQPLARARGSKQAVIFARKGAGINQLSDVAHHRAAFAHTNSITSSMAKVHLARAGICVTNLVSCENLPSPDPYPEASPRGTIGGLEDADDTETYAHSAVIDQVLAGECDVGVAPLRRFETHRGRRGGLVELKQYTVPSNLLVTKANLPPVVLQALQESLLSLTDKNLVGRLGRLAIDGFEAVTDDDFHELRRELGQELKFFETGRPGPASGEPAPGPAGP